MNAVKSIVTVNLTPSPTPAPPAPTTPPNRLRSMAGANTARFFLLSALLCATSAHAGSLVTANLELQAGGLSNLMPATINTGATATLGSAGDVHVVVAA